MPYTETQPFGPTSNTFEPAAYVSPDGQASSYAPVPGWSRVAHVHDGIDLAYPLNTNVPSPFAGTVSYVGDTGSRPGTGDPTAPGGIWGFGKTVEVTNNAGMVALFGHLNRQDVKPGDIVKPGTSVGLSGSTGNSTGPHLHESLFNKQGQWLNPDTHLTQGARAVLYNGTSPSATDANPLAAVPVIGGLTSAVGSAAVAAGQAKDNAVQTVQQAAGPVDALNRLATWPFDFAGGIKDNFVRDTADPNTFLRSTVGKVLVFALIALAVYLLLRQKSSGARLPVPVVV